MNHVNGEFPATCVAELIEQIKNREFSLDMAANVFCVLAWITAYARDQFSPQVVWGASDFQTEAPKIAEQLLDLEAVLDGPPTELTGPVSSAFLLMLVKRLAPLLINYLKEEGLDWLIDLLNK